MLKSISITFDLEKKVPNVLEAFLGFSSVPVVVVAAADSSDVVFSSFLEALAKGLKIVRRLVSVDLVAATGASSITAVETSSSGLAAGTAASGVAVVSVAVFSVTAS